MNSSILRRLRPFAALLIALCASAFALVGLTAAAPAGATAPVSGSHPYSDPVWFPVHAATTLDCVKNNPGCRSPHKYWMIDVVPTGQNLAHSHPSHAGVYAMGAGILHVGDAHGVACGRETSYGTWIWIDHGGGTVSRYGHLSKISVRNGSHVAAGQQIGVVGTTGKKVNCHINYVDFSVQHHGLLTAHSVELRTLRACSASTGRAQVWPSAVHHGYATWNRARQGTTFPANSSRCISNSVPHTATAPRSSVSKAGKGALVVRWTRPSAAYHATSIQVQLSQWHPSVHHWDYAFNTRYYTVSPSHTSLKIGHLSSRKTYRALVTVHNGWGYSVPSAWHQKKVK